MTFSERLVEALSPPVKLNQRLSEDFVDFLPVFLPSFCALNGWFGYWCCSIRSQRIFERLHECPAKSRNCSSLAMLSRAISVGKRKRGKIPVEMG